MSKGLESVNPQFLKSVLEANQNLVSLVHLNRPQDLRNSIVEQLRELFDCELVSLFLVDDDNPSELILEGQSSRDSAEFPDVRLKIDSQVKGGITAHAASIRERVSLSKNEILDNDYIKHFQPTYLTSGVCFSLHIEPISNRRGQLVGLLRLNNRSIGSLPSQSSFSLSDHQAISILTKTITTLLENSRRHALLDRTVRLAQRTAGITSSTQGILQTAVSLLRADCGLLTMQVPDTHSLSAPTVLALGNVGIDPSPDVASIGPIAQLWEDALLNGRKNAGAIDEVKVNVGSAAGTFDVWSPKAESWIVAILRVNDLPVGVLQLESRRLNAFDAIDVELLQSLVRKWCVAATVTGGSDRVRSDGDLPLLESTEFYRSLADNTPVVMWRKDLFGVFQWVNEHFCRAVGKKADEILGLTDDDLFEMRFVKQFKRGDSVAIRDGLYEDPYERYIEGNGKKIVYNHVVKKSVKDRSGNVIGTQGAFVDASSDKFRELFDEAPIGFHELDATGRIRHVNKYECSMLGYSAEDMNRSKFVDYVDDVDRETPEKLIGKQLDGTVQTDVHADWYPWNLKKQDGSTVPVLIASRRVTFGGGRTTGLLCAVREISAATDIDAALLDPDSEYLEAIKQLPLAVFGIDRSLRVNFVNETYLVQEGIVDEKQVIGKTSQEIFGGRYGEKYDRDNRNVCDTGNICDKVEIHRKGLIENLVRVLKFPIHDAKGHIIGVQGVFWDYQDQSHAKGLLKQALQESRMARANAALQEKESMLTMLSHQLRSPAWQAFERMDRLVRESDPQSLLSKGEAEPSTRRLAAVRGLIRKTRGVAWSIEMLSKMIESDDMALKSVKQVNPRSIAKIARESARDVQLIRRVSDTFSERLGYHLPVPEFELSIEDRLYFSRSRLAGDIDLIEQAIGNVIENAFKYSHPASKIYMTCTVLHSSVTLAIKNQPLNALKIDAATQQKCREKNWRSPGALASDADGTGLGLWLVDRIMQSHTGKLRVHVTDDHGWNKIELYFPLK